MKIILTLLFFCFVAYCVAQRTTNGLQCDSTAYTCESCLASSGAKSGDCGWCNLVGVTRSDFCTTPASCTAYNGTYVTSAAQCDTCTTVKGYEPKYCRFGSNTTFITANLATCRSLNNPNTTGGSSSGTTSNCVISQACANARYAFACSSSCAACNGSNSEQAGRMGKVCKNVQTLINNESCVQELAAGCFQPYPNAVFSSDTTVCRPLILADLPSTTTTSPVAASSSATSSGSSTNSTSSSSSTASVSPTTQNATSSSATSQASSQASSASSQASSQASSVSSQSSSVSSQSSSVSSQASSQATSATSQASSQASSVSSQASSAASAGSGAATTVISVALLALVALFL